MRNNIGKRYDMIKVFATFLVVTAHASRMYTGNGVVTPAVGSLWLAGLTDFIYSFHMPLFICVSGAVYSMCVIDLGKYKNTLKFLTNKAKRLLIPYIVFGLLYVAPVMWKFGFVQGGFLSYCLNGIILAQNNRHLWYVLSLFIIFAFCALINKLPKKANCFLTLAILIAVSFVSNRFPLMFSISSAVKYAHYFAAGYIMNKYKEEITAICKNPFMLLLLAVGFALSYYKDVEIVKAYSMILIVFGLSDIIPDTVCNNKVFASLKRNSFGIYLFHPMIIYVMFYYLGNIQTNAYLLCFSIAAAAFAVSYVLTEIVRKAHLGIIIGEQR